MRVYIANFGEENYEWPVCKAKGTVATMNDIKAQPLWEQGKKEEYILSRMKNDKSARGQAPTRQTASRWYNLMTIISETADDLWIHRDGEKLFWTISKNAPHFFENKKEPVGRKRDVVVCHKPCEPWSDRSKSGQQLIWRDLHPKARDFLSTEATLQKLSEDYAQYAIALINGEDLSPWHEKELWKKKNASASKEYNPVTYANSAKKAAFRMARMAFTTAKQSNGQTVERAVKNKDVKFRNEIELEDYITALIEAQEGMCALSELPLEMDEVNGDKELVCSLDRIDSNGHYERDNLQVVCRFINRWKSDSDNEEFRRLLKILGTNCMIQNN